MEDIWIRIESWMQINAPKVLKSLQRGASETQIIEFEDFLSITLPEDIKSSYRIHNGQSRNGCGLIYGREFLSLQRIKDEWEVWKELLDDGVFNDEDGKDQGSNPVPGIRNLWWSENWIPLTYDGTGNHDCIDLDPDEGGTVGQIITMWHDDADRSIIAPSFGAWLKQYADGLESGQLIFSRKYNGIVRQDDIY